MFQIKQSKYEERARKRLDRVRKRLGGKSKNPYHEGEWSGWRHHNTIRRNASVLSGPLFIGLVLSLIFKDTFLIAIMGTYALYFLLNFLYLELVWRKLEITILEEQMKMFTEEDGMVRVIISQKGWLPIIFGKLRIGTDKNILFLNGDERLHLNQVEFSFSLFGRSDLMIELPFTAQKRGVAKLLLFDVEISHFFGVGRVLVESRDNKDFEVLIYPGRAEVAGMDRIRPKRQGDSPSRSSFYDDYTTVTGARAYESGDPFNHIHWKASAKLNSMQTKTFQRTSQLSWLFVLDIRTEDVEVKIKGMSHLMQVASKKGIPFSILVNIKKFGKPSYVMLNEGEGRQHLHQGLTMLARLRLDNVVLQSSVLEGVVYQHAESSPYVILCMDKERYRGWELPAFSDVYALRRSGEDGLVMDLLPKRVRRAAGS
ncbi:DUF58 domain-containing protein [Bacillus tianshenii]|uniref:DUF58 domain-containing protein n=1 Tax=Sutcliffiella tianshenii TaxID=1463404 RepID=UPI001CD3419B|nr:DUF58 domain-containing protein [Bacillus tianshenii]MCA1321771.1 DUF58 domain-containing protein [Bacillus tianshenii]